MTFFFTFKVRLIIFLIFNCALRLIFNRQLSPHPDLVDKQKPLDLKFPELFFGIFFFYNNALYKRNRHLRFQKDFALKANQPLKYRGGARGRNIENKLTAQIFILNRCSPNENDEVSQEKRFFSPWQLEEGSKKMKIGSERFALHFLESHSLMNFDDENAAARRTKEK